MLHRAQLIPYLLERSLITAESVVAGHVSIENASRRNQNFAVVCRDGPVYFIKQGIDIDRIRSVTHEARVYQALSVDPDISRLCGQFLIRYVDHDDSQGALILEFLPDARNLKDHHQRVGRFSRKAGALLGEALKSFHSLPKGVTPSAELHKPWILAVHKPALSMICSASDANVHLIRIVQEDPKFLALLGALEEEWIADAFIHADMRWENCLIEFNARLMSVKLIDWELAGVGDPAWDVGSMFSSYLSCWLLHSRIAPKSTPDEILRGAQYPLESMQPAIRSFWKSYVRGMHGSTTAADHFLLRAIRYAGAQLIQDAFEQLQLAPAMTGYAVCALQVSMNILSRPQEAAAALFGLDDFC
jgi:thiamine kinase-like enzyme